MMKKLISKQYVTISFICLLIGFMVAILFNTHQQPAERDTRDSWEIRTAIQEEQITQQNLYQEIAEAQNMLSDYEDQTQLQQIESLKESINDLRKKAGLTEVEGKGVQITLEPMFLDEEYQEYPKLNAELIQLLINELNAAGVKEIAIDDQRIISLTPIRDVNGNVYVNNTSIGDLPVQIKLLANEPDRVINHIEVSEIADYFALENVTINMIEKDSITITKYDGPLNVDELKDTDVTKEDEK
ncbi:DUF881 domain-containing protein [Gracilibacillus salinarum]|uniref:DUF881 domain-containing protein n=1 Tax=Gracilibacillus salinarum TaxID=2932255 RepID=A0ABY4GMR4_9BACI|nr:DUF881 domain-containing protein [Gracilibacillus salinarum]UOQ85491.1 DUF881 domain-containing protein [Gracilibacillus salinarum]